MFSFYIFFFPSQFKQVSSKALLIPQVSVYFNVKRVDIGITIYY